MRRLVLASLFIVAAASVQPAFAAEAEKALCGKGTKICACGKLPGALWNCCPAAAHCSCSTGVPDCKH